MMSASEQRRYVRPPEPLYFPTEEEVPESKRHLHARTALYQILHLAFADRAAIGCEQFVYWDPTDPSACLAPDAFVRLGQKDDEFDSWKVWERGAPHVAVEVVSPSDAGRESWESKLAKYRRLGVVELVRFDRNAAAPLEVWDNVGGDLVARVLVDPRRAECGLLGLSWVVVNDPAGHLTLRVEDHGTLLPTPAEMAAAFAVALELPQVVAQACGSLEVEALRGGEHLLAERLDAVEPLLLAHLRCCGALRRRSAARDGVVVGLAARRVDVQDRALDRLRCDAVLRVVDLLDRAAAVRLADGTAHRVRDAIAVHDDPPARVAGGAADRLDERSGAPEEPLLVRVQDRDQAHLGQVEALAQQVDADQHVVVSRAQRAKQLDAIEGLDVGVQIPYADAELRVVLGEVLRHALGQGGDEHALSERDPLSDHPEQVVDLPVDGAHLDLRIGEPGRADELLDHVLARLRELVLARRGGDEERSVHVPLELLELQRAVVEGAR